MYSTMLLLMGSGENNTASTPPQPQTFYSRKDKSLGLLCSNFLQLYNRDGVEVIGLDNAAVKLGVERRRIYDVVNILESIGVVARRAKNQYSWKGFVAIPKALEELKEDGLRENFSVSICCNTAKTFERSNRVVIDIAHEGSVLDLNHEMQEKSSLSSKSDSRKEKSLSLLTQNFLKLFLCSNVDIVSLDSAAMALLGQNNDSPAWRTKIRRLYDIANVFASMHLIEKTHVPETRRPAFRWLGWRGNSDDGCASERSLTESRKRVFGVDITNISSKKTKIDSSRDWKSNENKICAIPIKQEEAEIDTKNIEVEQPSKHVLGHFEFGPFTSVCVSNSSGFEQKNVRRAPDCDSLAALHRPQYHNQALRDLFTHYMEAWKTWYTEVAGKKQVQEVS